MIIDFHTHIFPDKIASAAVRKLQAAAQIPAHSDGTAASLQASMAHAGITHSVLLPVATNPLKLASVNNSSIERLGQPGFISFGAMHPEAPDWETELKRLASTGIKGIKIHPVYQDVDIDDIRFLRILDKAASLGLVTVMHAGDDIGFPGVVRCAPEMVRHALDQLGNIPLVLAHMGGWKNWDRVADCLADTGVYLDTSFSLGAIQPLTPDAYTEEECQMLTREEFCRIVRSFGSRRILFGTDSPWTDQKDSVEAILSLPLEQEEKNNILRKNAQRLLHL